MVSREADIRASFVTQAQACEGLGSPFTGRVCRLIAAQLDTSSTVGSHILNWPGDFSAKADNVALRLCGAINHLAMTGMDQDLATIYPPAKSADDFTDDALWPTISAALGHHATTVIDFLKNAPQTNEVRRSAALIPAWHSIATRFGMPLAIHELGASAGLNLYADQYGLITDQFTINPNASLALAPQWRGDSPLASRLTIVERRACDLAPVDIAIEANRTRMLAYIWPDQIERVARTRIAMNLARKNAAHLVEQGDAIAWLEQALQNHKKGVVTVFQHTIAWQYFPPALQQKGEELLSHFGSKADMSNPLARISMESDGGGVEQGAAMTLTTWPEGRTISLGRADFHGRWVNWSNPVF
jgi:hypothetical protein